MRKHANALLIILLIIPSILIIPMGHASDGQFIDHILLFEPTITIHSFNLTLEKNQKYEFICSLQSPGVEMELILSLTGPDGDGDGYSDEFFLGAGLLNDEVRSVSGIFGSAISGNYTVNLWGNVTENTNMHFAIYDRGESYAGNSIIYDTSGYYHTKTRQYWFDLKDDTQYTIIASRTNSVPGNNTFAEKLFGAVPEAHISIILYDEENRPFNIIQNVKLEHIYGMESASASFGVSLKGEYHISVEISSSIETANVMVILKEGNAVGDGPEDEPVEPETNSTSSQQEFTVSVPNWTFGVIFGVGMIFVLIAVAISRERNMRKIIR